MSHQQTSPNPDSPQLTQPALLVVWGLYAQRMGLIKALTKVKLKQKSYTHRPQTKVLAFLVALLAGLPHLQDINQAAHPLVKDQAVAPACLATTRQPVGRNASLVAWPATTVNDAFTYPLNVVLARYQIGDSQRHAVLLDYGQQDITTNLALLQLSLQGQWSIDAENFRRKCLEFNKGFVPKKGEDMPGSVYWLNISGKKRR